MSDDDRLPNALTGPQEWVHRHDGSPCPTHLAHHRTARNGSPWWCTEHQDSLRYVEPSEPEGELLFPQEVAALFRVDTKTVTRWADSGRLTVIRTLGGHRRFFKAEVMALREGRQVPPERAICPDDSRHYLDSHMPGGAWYGRGHDGKESPWQPVDGARPGTTAAAEERAPADATEA